ncbi:MAG TPA: P-II family nitrogen regulator [Candidatus Saccharimonadales bacterium]|nr:P-II family nitrogen regulator [Candidatus Saccharimonadales bacterium]
MKEIKAIIQPFVLTRVVEALKEIEGLPGVTVSDVRGFGRARAAGALAPVIDEGIEYVKKAKLEIVVPDHLVGPVLKVIVEKAHTGKAGDGKIFVYPVSDVVKIRSGERGEDAI